MSFIIYKRDIEKIHQFLIWTRSCQAYCFMSRMRKQAKVVKERKINHKNRDKQKWKKLWNSWSMKKVSFFPDFQFLVSSSASEVKLNLFLVIRWLWNCQLCPYYTQCPSPHSHLIDFLILASAKCTFWNVYHRIFLSYSSLFHLVLLLLAFIIWICQINNVNSVITGNKKRSEIHRKLDWSEYRKYNHLPDTEWISMGSVIYAPTPTRT